MYSNRSMRGWQGSGGRLRWHRSLRSFIKIHLHFCYNSSSARVFLYTIHPKGFSYQGQVYIFRRLERCHLKSALLLESSLLIQSSGSRLHENDTIIGPEMFLLLHFNCDFNNFDRSDVGWLSTKSHMSRRCSLCFCGDSRENDQSVHPLFLPASVLLHFDVWDVGLWIVLLTIYIPGWLTDSTSASDSSSNSRLWRQQFINIGGEASSNKNGNNKRPRQAQESTAFNGGSADPQQEEKDESQKSPPPDQLIQCRKPLGKFMVDLGEPRRNRKAERIRPPERTVRPLKLTSLPNSKNVSRKLMAAKEEMAVSLPENPVELSLSLDLFSAIRLLQSLGGASIGMFSAFWGTLRMLAPMIVARRCLAFLAYALFDHYNGRYLRRTYTKRMKFIQKLDLNAAVRATGRGTVQLIGMNIAGRLSKVMLDAAPCRMPDRICNYWFGLVWTLSVIFTARLLELWMTMRVPLLRIKPTASCHARPSPLQIFMRPWHILQWMRDPEESITRMFRFGYRDGPMPFQADSLLYPSTWPPLQVLTIVAIIHAIQRTLPSPPKEMLKCFCLQSVLYEEWFRILFKERRVVLGAIASILSFLATVRFVHAAGAVDGVAGVLLVPGILASLVAGWMNLVLFNERVVVKKKRPPAPPPPRRSPAVYGSDNLDFYWDDERI
eukprot:scaffold675_cov103-Cylindrotheca_fusiformis.AAC.17